MQKLWEMITDAFDEINLFLGINTKAIQKKRKNKKR